MANSLERIVMVMEQERPGKAMNFLSVLATVAGASGLVTIIESLIKFLGGHL
jgi:hypothetical protein